MSPKVRGYFFLIIAPLLLGGGVFAFQGDLPLRPRESLLLLQEVEAPPNDPSHLWYMIPSMALNEKGNALAVFNTKPPRVSILDPETFKLKASWGRKGKGPGEFGESFAWVGIINDTVFISQGHRTMAFSLAGRYLGQDILTLERTAIAKLLINRSSGMDQFKNVYFWNANPSSNYLIGKKAPHGAVTYLVPKSDFGIVAKAQREQPYTVFSVLRQGSVVVTTSHMPTVARYTADGKLEWVINLAKEVPFVKQNYKAVESGEIKLPMSYFWADEIYTILTFSNRDKRIGSPNIYYVFLDSRSGKPVEIAYAAQNVIRELSNDPDEILTHDLYNPWAVAHHRGTLFVFSWNSGRLQKYKLTWYQ